MVKEQTQQTDFTEVADSKCTIWRKSRRSCHNHPYQNSFFTQQVSATRNTCVPELTSTSYWACHISLSSATGKSRHIETPAAALFHVRANFSPYNEDHRSGIREKPRVISHSFDAGYKIMTHCVLISTFKTHSQEITRSSFCEVIGETRNIKNIVSSFVLLGQWSHWRYF